MLSSLPDEPPSCTRKPSPGLMAYDTALMTAVSGRAKELLLGDAVPPWS